MSPRISKIFLRGRTNCRYPSPPEDTPHHEGAAYRHNVPTRPNATRTTGTDPTRPPRPNASDGKTSRPLGGADDGLPTIVMPTTQQPHARTSQNRAQRETTSPTGTKQRRYNYSHQTQPAGLIQATKQPRRSDHWLTNTSEPTPRTAHAAVATHPLHRTGRLPRPSGLTRKTTKTASDHIGAGYRTSYQPKLLQDNEPTMDRPDASRPTPNRRGMQGSEQERSPMGWRQHAAPRPATTIPTNTTEHRDSTTRNATNQH